MKKLLLPVAACLALGVLAISAISFGQGDHTIKTYPAGDVKSIEMERQPCFGGCPVYKVVLNADGTITYTGTRFVDRLGSWTASVSPDEFGRLAGMLKKLNFNSFKSKYAVGATDMATQVVTVKRTKGEKKVTEYGPSGPLGLWAIQELIDGIMAKAHDWKEIPKADGDPGR